jgi:hypothetical protein
MIWSAKEMPCPSLKFIPTTHDSWRIS